MDHEVVQSAGDLREWKEMPEVDGPCRQPFKQRAVMILQADQSCKIEDTSRQTVLALSNEESFAVIVPATVKRECLELLRRRGGQPQVVVLRVFAAALFLLLESHLERADRVVMDPEYVGHEDSIKGMLMGWIRDRRLNCQPECIVFAHVGKHSRAHAKAARVRTKKEPADLELTTKQLRTRMQAGRPTSTFPPVVCWAASRAPGTDLIIAML